MPRQYLPEFKSQDVLAVQKGLPVEKASPKFQIAQSTLYRWIKECGQIGTDFSVADYTTLQRKSQRVDDVLQIICLSGAVEGIFLQKRLRMVSVQNMQKAPSVIDYKAQFLS